MEIHIKNEANPSPTTDLPLHLSAEELNKWKQEYGEISFIKIRIPKNKDIIGGYFKAPTIDIIKLVQDTAKKYGEIEAMEQLFINCRLKISPEIERNTKLKLSLFKQLGTLLETYEAEVVKY